MRSPYFYLRSEHNGKQTFSSPRRKIITSYPLSVCLSTGQKYIEMKNYLIRQGISFKEDKTKETFTGQGFSGKFPKNEKADTLAAHETHTI